MAKRDYSEMATRLVVAAIGSKNRWRRVTVMAVVVLALVGGAGFLAIRGVAANQAATLEADWRALQACVPSALADFSFNSSPHRRESGDGSLTEA